ncbi:MAG: sigma-70 family RNA polymerase sigma factor [Solirubrobacteraceae bacterium]|jgi:RNA polymerase sigma-70 factor (ECF subfamily)
MSTATEAHLPEREQIGFRRTLRPTSAGEQTQIAAAVSRAQRGDRDALRTIYLRYADTVYGYVLSIVHDHYEAEDITQQVFAKLIDAIGRFDDRGTPFVAWLLRLARNAALDDLRACRRMLVEAPPETAAPADDGDQRDVLRSALAELPPEQREVVVLRHIAGYTPAEIASRTGRSESAVHGLHHRGRRALRAGLTSLDATPHVTLRAA